MGNKLSILGCGWLGMPLAVSLIAQGWQIKGSTTSAAKLPILAVNGIDAYLVHLSAGLTQCDQFFESETLIVNVPPSLKKQSAQAYLTQMQSLVNQVELSPVKRVIFVSSTSVYPDKNTAVVTTDDVDPESALYQSELLFKQGKSFKTTVIRFAGLIGPGRSPSRFFAGKTDIPNGNAPVNLIHLDDCIGIIESLMQQPNFGETYHAAAPSHPSRKEFYTLTTQQAGLPLPQFIDELLDWKLIDSSKLVDDLSYQFKYPDLLELASLIE